jgi:phosphatidylglycerophosphatase A
MQKVISNICRYAATLGPIGYISSLPGTMGTLCAIPLFIVMRQHISSLPYINERFFIAFFLLVSVWIIDQAFIFFFNKRDPSEIVLDEVVGFFVVMMGEPLTIKTILLAFLYFRFFDIVKPFGIHLLEDIPGGWGIVLDDVAAAYAARLMLGITLLIV